MMAENFNKAAELLRQAAAELSTTTTSTCTNITEEAKRDDIHQAVGRIFSPYANRGAGRTSSSSTTSTKWQGWNRSRPTPSRSVKWAHKFLCLASPDQDYRPQKDSKLQLLRAGLGEKRIVFEKNQDPEHFKSVLFETYPKLVEGGGFELLRSSDRYNLDLIPPSKNGYTVEYLADSCALGQSIVHVRPLQKELDICNTDFEPTTDCPTEKCLICEETMPVIQIKAHLRVHQDVDLPVIKKKKVDTPICKFACTASTSSKNLDESEPLEEATFPMDMKECPICSKKFPKEDIELHSSFCCDLENQSDKLTSFEQTFDDELEVVKRKMSDEKWKISVVRSKFYDTALDQFLEASSADWHKPMVVNFIGEEGVDHGGLTREFFSLLFTASPVFEDHSFSLDPVLIEKRIYEVMGKAVAVSLINGYPGPRNLNKYITDFILTGKIPQFTDVNTAEVTRKDAVGLISEINNATDISLMGEEFMDVLAMTGFSKQLTLTNKDEAITAVKGYYLLYRIMTPVLQFIEGLKFQNVLQLLRKYPIDGKQVLNVGEYNSAEEIERFYMPSYSEDDIEKSVEKVIVYNFKKFLKRVERGRVNTVWVDPITNADTEVTLNCGHVLQALIGSSFLPRDQFMSNGILIFDHKSKNLSCVNTCAPSVTFCDVQTIQTYERFHEHFLNIIVCGYGFGMV